MNCSINHKIFNHIIRSSYCFSDNDLTIFYKSFDDNSFLGFVLPKNLGAAHKRNLFKRRCRSIFRDMNKKMRFKNIGVIIKTKNIDINYNDINSALSGLANKLLLK